MLWIHFLPNLNLQIGQTDTSEQLSHLCNLHLQRHVFGQLLPVHHPTPVLVHVTQKIIHLVICWEHA